MTSMKKRFGSGLNPILGIKAFQEGSPLESEPRTLKNLMVQNLEPGKFQPRKEFDIAALEELSASIEAQGILQPLVVREVRDGTYEIIAGERRWRAAQMAGLQQVPAIVTSVTDEEALAFGVIENIQRQDLNPIEEALALNRLIHDFGMTHEQVAKSVGKSRSSVSNTLRLLKLSKIVQDSLISKKIELGHAKALIVLSPDQQDRACQEIIHNKYNSRQVEQLVRKFKSKSNQNMLISHPKVPDWKKSIEYMLQMGVDIKVNEQGKGKVIISVNDAFQVEQIIDSLS